MSNFLIRICKLAELCFEQKDEKGFCQVCTQFNAYVKKHAHYEAKNDGTTPNPWKRNMDYSGYENSPYYGSMSEFLKKFPGGIKEWVVWRNKTKGKRNSMYNDLLPANVKQNNASFSLSCKADIDFEDQTQPEEYEPTQTEIEESQQTPTAEETKVAGSLVEKILEELLGDGVISSKDVEEWKKSQPLKIEQRKNKADDSDGLREELADLEHEQWAHWTKYMLKNLTEEEKKRWERQIATDYKDLSEKEKDGDREWADKVLKIVKKYDKVKKEAHYEPVGGDDVDKFEEEEPLYANIDKFKSIKDFLEQYRTKEQSAEDAALMAVKDMVAYWKLLLKGKNRRKQKGQK